MIYLFPLGFVFHVSVGQNERGTMIRDEILTGKNSIMFPIRPFQVFEIPPPFSPPP